MLLRAAAALLLLSATAIVAQSKGGLSSRAPINLLNLGDGLTSSFAQLSAVSDIAAQYINEHEAVLPAYELSIIHHDAEYKAQNDSITKTLKVVIDEIYGDDAIHMIIGPQFSKQAEGLLPLAQSFNLLAVSAHADSPDLGNAERFPNFFRTAPNMGDRTECQLAILRHFNWSTVLMLYEDSTWQTDLIQVVMPKQYHNLLFPYLTKNGIAAGFNLPFTGNDSRSELIDLTLELETYIMISTMEPRMARILLCEALARGIDSTRFVWILNVRDDFWRPHSDDPDICDLERALVGSFFFRYSAAQLSYANGAGPVTFNGKQISEYVLDVEKRYVDHYNGTAVNGTAVEWDWSTLNKMFDAVVASGFALDATDRLLRTVNSTTPLSDFTYRRQDMREMFASGLLGLDIEPLGAPLRFKPNGDRVIPFDVHQYQSKAQPQVAVGLCHPAVQANEMANIEFHRPLVWGTVDGNVPIDKKV